jgi:hypothetical protein
MPLVLTGRRFTADEYRRMVEAGILTAADRVELIAGEIVEVSPIGPPHTICLIVLIRLRVMLPEDRALVLVQGPLAVGLRHEFQPDVLLLRPRPGAYWRRIPHLGGRVPGSSRRRTPPEQDGPRPDTMSSGDRLN